MLMESSSQMKKLCIALLVFPSFVSAQTMLPMMACEVKANYWLQGDGLLKPSDRKLDAKHAQFFLNRATGQYDGAGMSNKDMDTTVFDYGSSQQAYKAVSKNRQGYVVVETLVVQVFVDGTSKPFSLSNGASISTGICKELPPVR